MIYPKKLVVLYTVFIFFFFTHLSFVHAQAVTCDDSNLNGKTDQQLQAILDACDKEISAQKVILENTQKQSSALEAGIADLTYNINKTQLDIKAKTAKIKQLGDSVVQKAQYIAELSERMQNIRDSIGKMIRDTYASDNASLVDVLLSSKDLSGFFQDVDDYASINVKLQQLTEELTGVKKTSETEKKDLETKKAQQEKLKFEQEQAKKQAENLKKEKQNILAFSKGQESLYKKAIADKQKLQNQIKNRLFRTVGGNELTFGEALKLIQPFESTIGVNAALVLAILTQESSINGLIGKNIGKCYYNQSAKNSANSVMSPSQIPSFLAIMSEIGLNPNTTPVSCPIYSDGAYGGAMGPAQFMPSTWWNINTQSGYKNRVGSIIGSMLPSPFNNQEAFVGTALYLKDAQTICKTAFSRQSDLWACSASKYYGGLSLKGSRLSSYMYGTYGYGHQVAVRAAQFQKDIDTLNL